MVDEVDEIELQVGSSGGSPVSGSESLTPRERRPLGLLEARNARAARRKAAAATLCLSLLLLLGALAAASSFLSLREGASSVAVLKALAEFERDFASSDGNVQVYTLVSGYSSSSSDEYAQRALESLEAGAAAFARLEDRYESRKRRRPALRRATGGAFRRARMAFSEYEAYARVVLESAALLQQELPNSSFDEYVEAYESAFGAESAATRAQLAARTARVARRTARLQSWLPLSRRRGVAALAVGFGTLFVALGALAWMCVTQRDEADAWLGAQDQLARQQAHEMRGKYAPAMYCMEHFCETTRRQDATVDDFVVQRGDMAMALVALKEVEAQHQARLDVYKMMRGRYVSRPETFDLVAFMRERLSLELAIANSSRGAAATTSGQPPPVDYRLKISAESGLAGHDAVYVRTDHYVLNHVVSNLLSNSRKHTYSGAIELAFRGEHNGTTLVFAVSDTGTGLPRHVVANLFDQGVATGHDRGTGLGLPSCALFCKVAGGSIRLVRTSQMDDLGRGGGTEFEFAIAGTVVQTDWRAFLTEEEASLMAPFQAAAAAAAGGDDPGPPPAPPPEAPPPPLLVPGGASRPEHRGPSSFDDAPSSQQVARASDEVGEPPEQPPPQPPAEAKPPVGPEAADKGAAAAWELPPLDEPRRPTIESVGSGSGSDLGSPSGEASLGRLPDNVVVIIVDDSGLYRKVVARALKKAQKEAAASGWTYHEFETIEAAQPFLLETHQANALSLVCLDASSPRLDTLVL